MKKILMVLFALFILFGVQEGFAQTYKLTLDKQKDIYYVRKGDILPYKSSQYSIYRLGDNIAYCIEPSNNITTYNYVDNGEYIDLPYSDELKEKLELIGYYGREYPGHNTVYYSMAAQALIWELTGTGEVTFWTMKDGNGTMIDVSNERNEIMNLVNNHKDTPCFGDNIEAYFQKELVLEDNNHLLSEFEPKSTGGNRVTIRGNQLTILPKVMGKSVITFKRKRYDDTKSIIFVGSDRDNSQTLGRLRFSKEVYYDLNFYIKGSKIKINKVDENNNKIAIEGIKFKIKNIDTSTYICENEDCTFLTNKNGEVITNSYLEGNFEIEEVENQIINGYKWNSEKKNVSINKNSDIKWNDDIGNYIEVDFLNQKALGKLELFKYGEEFEFNNNQIIYNDKNLSDIEFALFDENNNLITTIKTDKNGYATCDNLPLGKYYLIEKTNLDNYVQDLSKHYFEIKQINQYDHVFTTKVELKNYLKKGAIEISKVDSVTKKGIIDTVFEIYDEHNNLLFNKKTDENGKIMIENLPLGKYYLIEKEANYMYKNIYEKIEFQIMENMQTIKLKLENDKILGSLKLIKHGEELYIDNNEIKYNKINLEGIEFLLYDVNNRYIDTLVTNSDGYVKYDKLELGKYYVLEKSSLSNYLPNNNKYYFEIAKDGDKAIDVTLEIDNYLQKGMLEFTKTDLVTSEGIPNTIIEIYKENDQLLLTKKTDESGKIVVNQLPIGKYYIIEKEANSMYQITNEKVYFEVKENEEIIKAQMTNERITVPVPKTGRSDNTYAALFCGFFFLIGLGGIASEKYKTY